MYKVIWYLLLLYCTILFIAINYKKIFIIEKKNWPKINSSLKNVLEKNINTFANSSKGNKKQINKFYDKLIKQI